MVKTVPHVVHRVLYQPSTAVHLIFKEIYAILAVPRAFFIMVAAIHTQIASKTVSDLSDGVSVKSVSLITTWIPITLAGLDAQNRINTTTVQAAKIHVCKDSMQIPQGTAIPAAKVDT